MSQNDVLKLEELKEAVLNEEYCEIYSIVNKEGYNRSLLKSYCEAKTFRHEYKKDTSQKSLDMFKLAAGFFLGAIASNIFLEFQLAEIVLSILFVVATVLGVFQVASEIIKRVKYDSDEYIYSILLKFL